MLRLKFSMPILLFAMCVSIAIFLLGCAGGGNSSESNQNKPISDDDSDDDDSSESPQPEWYRSAVFMEIFVRSYKDSNGDGIGDFPGLTSKLSHVADLGVRAIWLMPIYPTPYFDSGYDVADYTSINPDYGAMDDFIEFLDQAHALGLKVFLDGVFNHTSYEHSWFVESRSSRDNPKHDWYIWADTPLFNCVDPLAPNFGSDRWTYDETRKQYYYHHFFPQMPDLNYWNPDVREAIKNVVRFWFDLGVDGFRLDVAHLYYEDAEYCMHHPLTHRFLKELRSVADEYDDRALVGEVAGMPQKVMEYFGTGADELNMVFNFDLDYAMLGSFYLHAPFPIDILMDMTYERIPPGGQQAVVLSNHDFYRYFDVLLRNETWYKMASTLQLTIPGTPFIYYGEEVGMADGTQIVVDYRDAARTPMHWDSSNNAGFTTGEPWIRMAPNYATNNVRTEDGDPDSILNHFRRLIELRNETEPLCLGGFQRVRVDSMNIFAFFRTEEDESILVVLNFAAHEQSFFLDLSLSPWFGMEGHVSDLYSGEFFTDFSRQNQSAYPITLPGYGFAIMRFMPNE